MRMTPTANGLRATLLRPGYPDPAMRVSDAERNDIADRLARHYGDGRLDKTEFDERVSRAMAAKTVADFEGLFEDLPDLPDNPVGGASRPRSAPGTPSPADGHPAMRRGRPRGPVRLLLTVVLALVVANIAWHALTGWFAPVLWLAFLVAIVVVASRTARRH